MIDIDHISKTELVIINRLKELNFSGIIILDDIHHPDSDINICMTNLWNSISDAKYDFSKYGHWSGTGVIIINDNISFDFT